MQNENHLIWIDMEMTGLNPETDSILEIATLITDNDLRIVAEGPVLAVHQSDEVLASMNEWCIEHHTASGLVDRVRESRIDTAQAEALTLDFVKQWVPEKKSPLCGNSVGQDRRFLYKYMPALQSYLHYRTLDVSTVKILAQRWFPTLPPFEKKECHLALDDIRESIAELAYYRKHLFHL
ncbi:MAG: oligoribonuclease [Victivallales bacterium]|nr:oligoribonuclease [Victivallales bacterium]